MVLRNKVSSVEKIYQNIIEISRSKFFYLDYGIFQPIQISAITALNETRDCVEQAAETYRTRRNRLILS